MVLEKEIASIRRIESRTADSWGPVVEDWRRTLAHATRTLGPWACSARSAPLWVSNVGKVSKLLDQLNARIEHVDWLLGINAPAEPHSNGGRAERDATLRAVDTTVSYIGFLVHEIDAELGAGEQAASVAAL